MGGKWFWDFFCSEIFFQRFFWKSRFFFEIWKFWIWTFWNLKSEIFENFQDFSRFSRFQDFLCLFKIFSYFQDFFIFRRFFPIPPYWMHTPQGALFFVCRDICNICIFLITTPASPFLNKCVVCFCFHKALKIAMLSVEFRN